MKQRDFKTFWDIEQETTWRISVLFVLLLVLYFVPIYIAWLFIQLILQVRQSIGNNEPSFTFFGISTVFILVIAGLAAIVHWRYSNKNVVSKILALLGANTPDPNDRYHSVFQNIVDEITTAAGSIHVERYIIPTGAMNAFALADVGGRMVVGVTEGLLSRCTREELQGVMAHEVAHIVSRDCLQTTTICSLFGIYSEALAHINKTAISARPVALPIFEDERPRQVAASAVASLPLLLLLFVTDQLGQLLNMFISREKEYRADANAAKYSRNPIALARALYKIATHWRGAGYGGEYLAPIFILRPEFSQLDEQESIIATLFSTHPPLAKRLQVLLDMAHASMEQLSQELQHDRKIKTETEVVIPQVHVHAQHNGTWEGPFTLPQLQTFDWLRPETKIRLPDSEETFDAGDIPAINAFFQKQEQPIWKIKRLCPDCREWLVLQEYEGLYIWRCAYCSGILVDIKKLPRIIVRKEKGFSERVQRIARLMYEEAKKKHPKFNIILGSPHPRSCPKCGKPMIHKFYSYAYHVEIDECSYCHVVWFDKDELEILQCLIEMGESA
ncbi:M48 family metalloprotease [candidate division WOR-3 bacterium]|nr:M48 family metalloprotease [candidate division WOR-3 bacterium]